MTMEELADIYDKCNYGRKARTLPMEQVMQWAEQREDLFYFDKDETLQLVGKKQCERITNA